MNVVPVQPSSRARAFIRSTKAASVPARCSATATAQSFADPTAIALSISSSVSWLARLEPDLRAAHRAGVLAARYHGVERHLAALERLHREQHGHDLGHGRRLELLVRVRYIKLLSVRRIQRSRFRVQRPELRQSRRIHEQQTEHRRRADHFFHCRPPLSPHFMRFVCALCLFCIDKRCPAAL